MSGTRFNDVETQDASRGWLGKVFHDMLVWLLCWLVATVVIFATKFLTIWNFVGGTWRGLIIAYVIFYCGGSVIYFAFTRLDRIQHPGLKFVAQMFLCLMFAIVVGAIILFVVL